MTREEEASKAAAELRRGTRRPWLSHMGSAVMFSMALMCGVVGVLYSYWGAGMSGGTLWMFLMAILILSAAVRICRISRAEPEVLERHMNATAIGPLTERMEVSFGSERRAVIRVLIRLLDRIEPEDSTHITKSDRVRLDNVLLVPDFFKNADLLAAIVRAYERIGNEQSLELVHHLAEYQGAAGREREVRDAARSVLPKLASRVAQQRVGAELLRASAQTVSADTLLRPTAQASPTPPIELLRAGARSTGAEQRPPREG